MPDVLTKVLVANRGEIAVRVIRACREMGLRTVAVYSECDRTALHVRYADEAYPIGPSAPRDSYLRIDTLIDVARRSGADARAPGVRLPGGERRLRPGEPRRGPDFIGPSPEAIALMGSKTAARAEAIAAGVPGRARDEGPPRPGRSGRRRRAHRRARWAIPS